MMTETSLVRIKPAAGKIFIPTLILGLTIFALSYLAEKIPAEMLQYSYLSAAVVITLFWVLPVGSYLLGYLEITNERIIYRSGFLGFKKQSMDFTDLSSIEIARPKAFRSKAVLLRRVDETELQITGYSRPKLIAAEIERLAKSTLV